jgi:TPR repeat protein
MLGLDQPDAQSGPSQPSIDSLRERSFSGLDSFFEPEQPRNGVGRILLLLVLLAALGAAGWWAYTNYLGATEPRKAEIPTSTAAPASGESAAETPPTKPESKDAAAAPDAGSSQPAVPSAAPSSAAASSGIVPEGSSENASPSSDAEAKPVVEPKPATPKVTPEKIAATKKIAAKREPGVTSARAAKAEASKQPPPEAVDKGDADFRKADAFLYGRGAAENCDQAVKYLKSASAKSNAKARSAFGTMYATGHCVPRDLPTSYLWFALALQVDPNNQILEKDLNSVWSEMTPPERQLATRMKQ